MRKKKHPGSVSLSGNTPKVNETKTHPLSKFREKRFTGFCVILLTNLPTNKRDVWSTKLNQWRNLKGNKVLQIRKTTLCFSCSLKTFQQ